MFIAYEVGATLIALAAGLWVRRDTWRYRWERAGTINLATIAYALFCMTPTTAPAFTFLRGITGVWNLEDLTGHCAYLAGIAVLTHGTICHLDMPDVRHFIRWRIELPATIVAPCIIGAFVAGSPSHHATDLLSDDPSPWMQVYWVLFSVSAAWILSHLLWALLILRTDPASTTVATLYTAAVVTDLSALASCILSALIPTWPDELTWVLINSACVGYAIAAIRGMHGVRRWFRTRQSTPGGAIGVAPPSFLSRPPL